MHKITKLKHWMIIKVIFYTSDCSGNSKKIISDLKKKFKILTFLSEFVH